MCVCVCGLERGQLNHFLKKIKKINKSRQINFYLQPLAVLMHRPILELGVLNLSTFLNINKLLYMSTHT